MTNGYSFLRLTKSARVLYVRVDQIVAVLPTPMQDGEPQPGSEILLITGAVIGADENVVEIMARMVALMKGTT